MHLGAVFEGFAQKHLTSNMAFIKNPLFKGILRGLNSSNT